jgi:RHS repeat-associated protein
MQNDHAMGAEPGTVFHGQEANPAAGTLYQPHRFAGRQWDAESDLYYYRSRYYDPSLGRFISLDTIGIWGDLNNYGNGYAYVGNQSNSAFDPFGTDYTKTYDEGHLTIEITIQGVGGDGAQNPNGYYGSAAQQSFAQAVEEAWTTANSTAIVTVVGESSDGIRTYSGGGYNPQAVPNSKGGKTVTIGDGQMNHAGHEAGHLLGLPDNPYVDSKTGKPKKADIMNQASNGPVTDDTVKRTLGIPESHPFPTNEQLCDAGPGEVCQEDSNNPGVWKAVPRQQPQTQQQRTVEGDGAPNVRELLACGRLKSPPNDRERIREHTYDSLPLQAQLKWRHQRKRPSIDGRGPVLSWWKFQAPVINWDNRMGLLLGNRSGVVDPVR